jgi:hypothetical protein
MRRDACSGREIELFWHGVCACQKYGGRRERKGGLKVHLLTDVHTDSAQFATISEAKMHDKKFLSKFSLAKGSMEQ